MELRDIYSGNPFFILGASAGNTRAELIDRQEELALFGNSGATEQALSRLLNPQTRLEAEIQWFPLMSAREVQNLIAFFDLHRDDAKMPGFSFPSVLAQFNMLRLALSRMTIHTAEVGQAVFHSLALAADALLPGQIMEEINEDRRHAGYPEVKNRSEIETQIRTLLAETARVFMDRMSGPVSEKQFQELSKAFAKEYKSASSPYHNSYLLEIAADYLAAK